MIIIIIYHSVVFQLSALFSQSFYFLFSCLVTFSARFSVSVFLNQLQNKMKGFLNQDHKTHVQKHKNPNELIKTKILNDESIQFCNLLRSHVIAFMKFFLAFVSHTLSVAFGGNFWPIITNFFH